MNIDLKANKSYNPSEAFMDMIAGRTSDEDIVKIDICRLKPFPDQKTFHKYRDDKFKELTENIRECGVLSPIIVRPLKNAGTEGYQILSGHNRTRAAAAAGLTKIPCIVKNVDDNTANIIFVATNLNQREKLLPSEKAFGYKILMDSKGCQFGTAEDIAKQGDESRRQIFRYLRLTLLTQPFLDLIDNNNIPVMAGVNISYLNKNNQQVLYDFIKQYHLKISLSHSEAIKNIGSSGNINEEELKRIFNKKNTVSKKSLKLPMNDLRVYFNGVDDTEIVKKIIDIIKNYYKGKE